MQKIIFLLCVSSIGFMSSACSSGTADNEAATYTLVYSPGAAVIPDASSSSYTFSSTGEVTRTVTTNSGATNCGEDSATLNSTDLSTLDSSISNANLLEQSDAIDEECAGVGTTTYSYTEGTQSNEFSVQDSCDAGFEPDEVGSLRETLSSLIESYFPTDISCP